jgi:hypothetical protein
MTDNETKWTTESAEPAIVAEIDFYPRARSLSATDRARVMATALAWMLRQEIADPMDAAYAVQSETDNILSGPDDHGPWSREDS